MMNHCRISTRLLIALWAIFATALAAPVRAQRPEEPPEEPSQEELEKTLDVPEPQNPAVQAILETNPSTPAEWARAAKILADLGRPDLGKQLLKRILDVGLSQQKLAELADRFGSPMFVDMAARPDMLPEARQLAEALLAAANRQLQDPKRLARLIGQLKDPSADARYRAIAGLQEARGPAVAALIGVLADPDRAAEHAHIRAALARMGSDAVEPLLGILAEPSDAELTVHAIRVLAQMDVKEATVYLLRPCLSETTDAKVRAAAGAAIRRLVGHLPTRPQAVRILAERAKAYFDRRRPMLVMAARLARDAFALAGDDPEIRRFYLATMLQAAAYENGLDRPLPDSEGTAVAEAAAFGVTVIEDVMEHAIAEGHVAAATAAARILGRIGTAEELLRQGARPAPLVRAARHSDRRLRMAATDAIVRLQPTRPFPGSSFVPQSLAFFAASRGVRRALVAGPSTEGSRRLAGKLTALGYRVDTAVAGREAFRLATASPDYELALIDAAIEQPTIDLLVQELRRDCRSADLRVGLVARSGYLERAGRIARRDPFVLAFSRPHTGETIAWQVEQLATLAPRTFVAHTERQRQATDALERLAEISSAENPLYDIRQVQDSILASLYTPTLSTRAVAVLENLNSPRSQQALVEVASRWTQPLEVRQAAVKAFRRNTQEHGILLRGDEIRRQYDRYNESEDRDRSTQHVLGLILDCIEAPTRNDD